MKLMPPKIKCELIVVFYRRLGIYYSTAMRAHSLIIFFLLLLHLDQANGDSESNDTNPSMDSEMFFLVKRIAGFSTSMANLSIVDYLFKDPVDNNTLAKRRILNDDREDITISEVDMIVPENISMKEVDTTKLSVDYSKVQYALRPVIASPFAIGSLLPSKDASSNVLIVGLGGGQLDNFLHFTFPKMNITTVELEPEMIKIAKKYFGLKQDKYHKVLAMDGIKYIEDAAKKQQKFDTVFIDACPTIYPADHVIFCPDEGFISDKTIENIQSILAQHGCLVIKMLLNTDHVLAKAEEIEHRFVKEHLKCSLIPMPHPSNRVLICGNDDVTNEEIDPNSMMKAMENFYVKFNLP